MVFGSLQGTYGLNNWDKCTSPYLMHLEFGADGKGGLKISQDLSTWWQPTMALRTDTDAEDYVDLREDMSMKNNLEQFLDNFLHYIAERVAEGNYTLTLSAAVYAALEQQEGQTILALLNTKGWTVASA